MNFETFVLHYTKLQDRKLHFQKELKKCNIDNYTIITKHDQEQMDYSYIDSLYKKHDEKYFRKACDTTLNKIGPANYPDFNVNCGNISLILKHLEVLSIILGKNILIFEDDFVCYYDNIDIEKIIAHAPLDWDVIFLGGALNLDFLTVKNQAPGFIQAEHPSTNTTSSMIYSPDAAKQTYDFFMENGFVLPIDWQLNYVFKELSFNVWHTNPRLCGQAGDHRFKSSIQI